MGVGVGLRVGVVGISLGDITGVEVAVGVEVGVGLNIGIRVGFGV